MLLSKTCSRSMLAGYLLFGIVLSVLCLISPDTATGQTESNSVITSELDAAAKSHATDSAVAGVSVAVVHKNDTLLMDGYGMADLEFDVPMPEDAIFEIGSITKQFTAAAILQLAGKDSLDLDDTITEHLSDYSTRGHKVTIRQLLHHTSGLRSYTNMLSAQEFFNESLNRDTLLTLVEAEPLRFAPGTAMSYSNTGYFLLGLIIEKKSGQSYENFVAEHLFEPAGMKDSYYCDEQAVRQNRAHGYGRHPQKGFVQKANWVHKWPYSAGSLCSTAPDLVNWNQALHSGQILPDSLYHEMITPGKLADGTRLRYGMGLRIHENNERPVIGHGGGIAGYISESRYYPSQDLIIVALQNTTSPPTPQALADSLSQIVLGKPTLPEPASYKGNLNQLSGRYVGPSRGSMTDLSVETVNGKLIAKRGEGEASIDTLNYVSDLTWSQGDNYFIFVRLGEEVVELRVDVVSGHYVLRRIREP